MSMLGQRRSELRVEREARCSSFVRVADRGAMGGAASVLTDREQGVGDRLG